MIKYFIWPAFCLVLLGCKNYSGYALDDKPIVKLDTSLCGIWKCAEDTDKANFVLVQTLDDLLKEPPSAKSPADMLRESGYHMKDEDTAAYNKRSHDVEDSIKREWEKRKDYPYQLTYFDHHGINPHFQTFDATESIVKGKRFLNVYYHHVPLDSKGNRLGEEEEGYLLVRLLQVSNKSIVTAMVADTTLKYAQSAAEVRKKVTNGLNNSHYYSDTMHFYKVNNYHVGFWDAPKHAN